MGKEDKQGGWFLRLVLLMTLPLASHALALAAVAERTRTRTREPDPAGMAPLDSAWAAQHEFAELQRNHNDV